jgi:surface carbohydrate biosynthesis protein
MKILSKIPANKVDILVIDDCLKDVVAQCIPQGFRCTFVKIRGVVPYVHTTSFFVKLVVNLIKFRLNRKKVFLSSLINELKPKVILTFNDNANYMKIISVMFPEVKLISIQNGLRVIDASPTTIKGRFCIDYYSFGEFERKLFAISGVYFSNHYPVGSLKLGLFLSKSKVRSVKSEQARNIICFVSQTVVYSDNISTVNMAKKLYQLTVNWAEINNFSVLVLLRNSVESPEYVDELNFYKDTLDLPIVKYLGNDSTGTNSYKYIATADIFIGIDSTLLMEVFGCGKKVLWGCFFNLAFSKERGMDIYFDKLPKETLLDGLNKEMFNEKINTLISIDQKVYEKIIYSSRLYFMNFEKKYPHDVISSEIRNFLLERKKF